MCVSFLDVSDSYSLGFFGSLLDLELNALVFLERAMTASLDLGVVDEEVLRTAVRGDEAEALVTACDSIIIRSSVNCVPADFFIRKDATWTTRTCFLTRTHRNMLLQAKPPENRSSIQRFRTGPTPNLLSLQRNDRERLCGRSALHPSCADHSGPRPGQRQRRCTVAAFSLNGR
jgi:hypothetical protein